MAGGERANHLEAVDSVLQRKAIAVRLRRIPMGLKDLGQQAPETLDAEVVRGSLIKHPTILGPQSSQEQVQGLYQISVRQIARHPSFLAYTELEVSDNIVMI
jgi:hypothetical protein